MLKLRKLVTMGLAAMMAVSAMSISAFAKEAIYDDAGEIVGYQYTADEIDWDKVAQHPAPYTTYAMTSSQPSYSAAMNLASADIYQSFSLSKRYEFNFSKAWYNSGEEVGIILNEFSVDPNNFEFNIYKISSNGTITRVKNYQPTISNPVAISFGDLTSNNRYCLRIQNKDHIGSTTGFPVITNDLSSFLK